MTSAQVHEQVRTRFRHSGTDGQGAGQILSINQSNDATRSYKEVDLTEVQSAVYATEVSKAEYLTYTTEETEKMRVLARAEQLEREYGACRQAARRRIVNNNHTKIQRKMRKKV